eukprot:TRINITY_DN7913_c0_g1_i3.p1 TRINITY_DN7913_c0_g1~~TRINITY_DN7913_c0_g1_i3.p1  ORF type:complete len:158 (+),score=51.74 TRINITY_DN7913_c0_g1_i3:57-476(+)
MVMDSEAHLDEDINKDLPFQNERQVTGPGSDEDGHVLQENDANMESDDEAWVPPKRSGRNADFSAFKTPSLEVLAAHVLQEDEASEESDDEAEVPPKHSGRCADFSAFKTPSLEVLAVRVLQEDEEYQEADVQGTNAAQ